MIRQKYLPGIPQAAKAAAHVTLSKVCTEVVKRKKID
jgi:hypothetical protein